MKSLKPFFLVLAGALITVALFSFKSEEPKSEALIFNSTSGYLRVYSNGTVIKNVKVGSDYKEQSSIMLSTLVQEGWSVKAVMGDGTYYTLFMERTKQ